MIGALRDAVRAWPAAARLRFLRLNWIARTGGHQDFSSFVSSDAQTWRAALAAAGGKRVLIATNTGGHFPLAGIDRLLAMALTLRGAAVTSVLCDAALPACQMCEYALTPSIDALARRGPDSLLCGYCHAPAEDKLAKLELPYIRLSACLDDADRAEARRLAATPAAAVPALEWRGMRVGEHALAGALRFYARGDLEGQPRAEAILARYVESAVLTAAAYARLIERERPEVLVAHHGIYTPQGLAAEAARVAGVRIVTWNPAYRRSCFIFSHDDTYHHTLMTEPTSAWEDEPFGERDRAEIVDYLQSRRTGERDWIRFHHNPQHPDLAALGLDPAKPYALALTNVFWDAQLHYPASAFPSQLEWLTHTVRHFANRPDMQLVIRIHPAELTGAPPSRQRAEAELRRRHDPLPGNVCIIGPESALSTYQLAEGADAALIYGTKTGVELAALGVPVIVAGEAWARGKGFTTDVASPADYEARLAALPFGARLDPQQQERALRYARHFFFRRMIEVGVVAPAPGARRFNVTATRLADIEAGADAGLDVICRGILDATPFLAESHWTGRGTTT